MEGQCGKREGKGNGERMEDGGGKTTISDQFVIHMGLLGILMV